MGKKRIDGVAGRFVCLTCVFSAGAATMLFFIFPGGSLSAYTLIMGVVFGVFLVSNSVFLIYSLSIGPMALVNLIVSCSMLIPAFSGLLVWKEKVTVSQLAGIVVMIFALVLCADVIGGKSSPSKGGRKWIAASLFTAFLTGSLGVVQKVFQMYGDIDETSEFIAVSFAVGAFGAFLMFLFFKKTAAGKEGSAGKQAKSGRFPLDFWIISLAAGCILGVLNYMNLYLINVFAALLFFPIYHGGNILLSAISGRVVFGEKMNRAQTLGFFLGIAAILLLGNIFDLFAATGLS